MKQLQIVLLMLLFVLPAACLQSQINIRFIPVINGYSVDGLFTAQVQNTGTSIYHGKIKITVRDADNKTVLLAHTPGIMIKPGINVIQPLAAETIIQFGNSISANIVAQTGRFPENEYDYCFEVTAAADKPAADDQVFENCYNYTVQAVIPLSLVYPVEGDELCNTRPGFTWQPAAPMIASYRYRIVVAEKKDRQSAADALTNNIPVIQQNSINGFMLPFPSELPSLEKDKKYVWQAAAFSGNTKITQSEIWVFGISCPDNRPDTGKESYRQLSASLNGNYYMAAGTLRFSIINPYSMAHLQYSITDISDAARSISNLPVIKVQTGLNKIDLPLADLKNMQANKTYLLKIKNIGDHNLYLQFIYKGYETQ